MAGAQPCTGGMLYGSISPQGGWRRTPDRSCGIRDGIQITEENFEVTLSAVGTERFRVKVYKDAKKIATGEAVKLPLAMGTNQFEFLIQGVRASIGNMWITPT
jgi:hypothetical protein